MTCSNTNPAAAQAFALVYARIAAATAPIFYRNPAPVAAAFFHMASAAVRMGRVDALFKRGGVQRRRGIGPLMGPSIPFGDQNLRLCAPSRRLTSPKRMGP